jgi:peptidoglycan/LPS O-acetylase OafA/YrhL
MSYLKKIGAVMAAHVFVNAKVAVNRLPNIQILRACAALMIVVYHCGIETTRLAEAAGRSKLFEGHGWGSGVSLFFTISGFIMVVTTAHAFGSPHAVIDFMRRRIIRIVPLYWLVTTIVLGAAIVVPSITKAPPGDYLYVISSYLFWPYTNLTGYVRPLATLGWTLNLEMLFYFVFAATLFFPRRVGLSLLFVSLGFLVLARESGLFPGVALNFWGDPIVFGFLFGAVVGIAYNNGVRVSGPLAATLMTLGFAALFFPWTPIGAEDDLLPRLAESVPSILVLIAVALGPQVDENQRTWRPALAIGDASYSLYLVHAFLLRSLYFLWLKGPLGILPLWTFIPIGIAISVLVAMMTYWYFERPVTRWLNGQKTPKRLLPMGHLAGTG